MPHVFVKGKVHTIPFHAIPYHDDAIDISTIVIDLGSSTIKVGFAGEDAPRWVFSSVVGHIRKYGMVWYETRFYSEYIR